MGAASDTASGGSDSPPTAERLPARLFAIGETSVECVGSAFAMRAHDILVD